MPAQLNLRLDWSEMDMFGHINNVSYFKFIQASRLNYWEAIGLTQLHGNMGIGPVLASVKCDFKKQLRYPGDIRIESSLDFIKNSSFGLVHRIFDAEDQLAAIANDIIVAYNFKEQMPVIIPDDIRQAIEKLEGGLPV
ncbi:MAG: acyl-CoA thioesterase [Sphingobacteriales bacterium]|nr:MAG: acyl-CoA thioesterase [Sphingobacteriales bacterium]